MLTDGASKSASMVKSILASVACSAGRWGWSEVDSIAGRTKGPEMIVFSKGLLKGVRSPGWRPRRGKQRPGTYADNMRAVAQANRASGASSGVSADILKGWIRGMREEARKSDSRRMSGRQKAHQGVASGRSTRQMQW